MQSNMSILGLYNYDNTLFANMAYPTGFENDDKTTLTNNLLMELAELEVVYPNPSFMKSAIGFWSAKEVPTWDRIYAAAQAEYNPIENYDRQESSTDITDGTRQHTGTDTVTNSGTDTVTNSGTDTVTNSGTDTVTNSGTDTVTNSGKDTTQQSGTDTSSTTIDNDVVHSGTDTVNNTGTDTTTNSGSDTTTNQIASYDSTTLQTHDTSALAHGHVASTQHGLSTATIHGEHIATDETTSGSVTHGMKEELTHGHVEATQHGLSQATLHGHVEATQHGLSQATLHGHVEATQHGLSQATQHGEKIDDDVTITHTSRIHGNIGVTTSQQMLEQELEVSPKLNIMNYIIESFKNRFCIMVY